jgi:hypothetical protein
MNFDQALPRLIASYRRGNLVPFIGSGMSSPSCNLWRDFFDSLNRQAFRRTVFTKDGELIQRIDRAVKRLSRISENGLESACRKALVDRVKAPSKPPPQTVKLASIPWSLVLTTNYDDWFPTCANDYARDGDCYKWRVLGRSVTDCHEVLSSLNARNKSILWALQGFLGGQGSSGDELDVSDKAALAKQIVVGHEQYQRVMHSAPHFRRAFAEVFRRRALWFLGSGLEDYFVNLFGEVITTYGPNCQPHFLTVMKGPELDEEFLSSRLNTKVIAYDDHTDIPKFLEEFEKQVSLSRLYTGRGARSEHRFVLGANSHLAVRYGTVIAPAENEWSAAGCGREGDKIREGDNTRMLVKPEERNAKEKWALLHPGKGRSEYGPSIFRFGTRNCFAIAARNKQDDRDLRVISRAVQEFLSLASKANIAHVHMSLLVGDARDIWHPMFSFVQMVRGISIFLREPGSKCPSITIYTKNRDILLGLDSGDLDICELLNCEDVRFFAEVLSEGNEPEVLGVTALNTDTVGKVAALLGLDSSSSKWMVGIIPRISEAHKDNTLNKIEKKLLVEHGVMFGSRIRFYRI